MKSQVAPKNVNILSRDVIKRNGVILYTILSSDGVTKYFATVENGKVTAHDCDGYINRGTCRHAQYIEQAEAMAQYDVVSEAVKEFDRAIADSKIGNHYELVGAMYQAQQQKQDQYPMLDSCECCGKLVKKGVTVCYDCGC